MVAIEVGWDPFGYSRQLRDARSDIMEALSRREESDLLEKGKKEAMKHCEDIVKGESSIVIHAAFECSIDLIS